MQFLSALLLVAVCVAESVAVAGPAVPTELVDRIQKVVRQHFPDAQITENKENGWVSAKHGTMTFTIHRHWKTGEILEKTDQVEGPNFEGFILAVSMQHGKYEGQAIVPQTLREPYWETYIDRPSTEDGKGHYVINFSYGVRLNPEFKKAIFEVLPRTKRHTKKP